MPAATPLAFLIDVDNTLLDNDRVIADLKQHLAKHFDQAEQKHYWSIFDAIHEELGYADYLGAIQRYRCERPRDTDFMRLSLYLLDYPFRERLYPFAMETLRHLQQLGSTWIVSDGDVVFQPRKVERSGLWEATKQQVLIYVHKEQELDDIERRCPARHFVVIDDKLRILSAIKKSWGSQVTTVFARQGHHALEDKPSKHDLPPDRTIEKIGDLRQDDVDWFLLHSKENG